MRKLPILLIALAVAVTSMPVEQTFAQKRKNSIGTRSIGPDDECRGRRCFDEEDEFERGDREPDDDDFEEDDRPRTSGGALLGAIIGGVIANGVIVNRKHKHRHSHVRYSNGRRIVKRHRHRHNGGHH